MDAPEYIIGYGSLLNAYSRQTFSGLHAPIIPVMATGWQRGWTTRYGDEAATYLGVRPSSTAVLSAALVPTRITDDIRHRERGYDFVPVAPDTVSPLQPANIDLSTSRLWIVVNREQLPADSDHPIPQSYIDTCLLGCLETGGREMAQHFITSTERWDGHRINDREWPAPLYPRGAPASTAQFDEIDALLRDAGV